MKKFFFISLLVIFPVFSKAAIAVEPYAGLGISCTSQYGCLSAQKTYLIPSIGTRVGYGFLKIAMLGLDVSYSRYDPFSKIENNQFTLPRRNEQGLNQLQATLSNTGEVFTSSLKTYNTWDVGPTIMVDLPFFFDGYTSLIYSYSSHSDLILSGAGFKIGAAYLSVPFVSVNIEFKLINYFSCTLKENLTDCLEQDGILGPMYTFSVFLSSPIKTGFL